MSTPVLEGVVVDAPRAVKIFGREPAVILGFLESLVAALVVFPLIGGKLGLDDGFTVALMAVISGGFGAYSAWVTKDTTLGWFLGFIKGALALGAYFGLHLGVDTTAAIVTVAATVVGLFQRTQTAPAAFPVDVSPQQVVPVAPTPDVVVAGVQTEPAVELTLDDEPPVDEVDNPLVASERAGSL